MYCSKQGQLEWLVGSGISLGLETLQPLWASECLWTERPQLNFSGCRSSGSSPGSECLPMLQQCEALWSLNSPFKVLFLSSYNQGRQEILLWLQSGPQSLFSTHTFQDAVNCPVVLCIWWCNSKFSRLSSTRAQLRERPLLISLSVFIGFKIKI